MYTHSPLKPEIIAEEFNIVMIGELNPAIFQPSWFSSEKLIRESEAETANVELIHSDFTSFSTDWFVMQISRDRFNLTVKSSAYKHHLTDLVIGTFQKLNHTPINQMGINFHATLRFKSTDDWHAFGHFVLPKSPWKGLLDNPGMRSASVSGIRNDEKPGFIQVIIDSIINPAATDATVRINNHYERKAEDKSRSAEYFLGIIEHEYDKIIEGSNNIVKELLSGFVAQTEFDNGVN